MTAGAYCIHRRFESAGPTQFRMDRHYFVYALSGTMRLEADGHRWMLTPARGALIASGHEVTVTILSPLTSAAVLFEPSLLTPVGPLRVFDVSPLCRELVRACRPWGPEHGNDPYSRAIFLALAAEICRLSETPSLCIVPFAGSRSLMQAIALTEDAIATEPCFETIAKAVGQSSRTLARRFSKEMGMTWRETLRRIRIMKAIELLATSKASVTEIAFSVGYASLSAFNAAFRDLVGMSPSEYRQSAVDL
ncbi:helix-turn-helix domain-containing protein [Roseomonas rosulenta]|uniref:helix-turn-helix domain-containing protein n=1 Tax=Roseomonas rosulenta TaxID=2748667 RepID=UPI0018E00BAB|nr:AraC family transcriptional regulator [Roseomonas rosulenta]